MNTRCLKCGENHRTGHCTIKGKIDNPTCINCNAKGHMASSTACLLYPTSKKNKYTTDNKNRSNNPQSTTPLITPGLSYAQVLNSNNKQQMAAYGIDPSTSTTNVNTQKDNTSPVLDNLTQNQNSEFTFMQAIMEMKKIFSLFPALFTEMEKSTKTNNPEEKLNCLVRGVCSNAPNSCV
ncbi:hypothetical protein TNCT_559011 [Trichonephila clavata]|uniref:Uncharacterized protein n=1 Tax=Trichonephila clavata TaxID=2740835 RepID=A0A8X6G3N4_TRICU|nr:hypothetical protein TNCT_559011 [Trichonephila clavata]